MARQLSPACARREESACKFSSRAFHHDPGFQLTARPLQGINNGVVHVSRFTVARQKVAEHLITALLRVFGTLHRLYRAIVIRIKGIALKTLPRQLCLQAGIRGVIRRDILKTLAAQQQRSTSGTLYNGWQNRV